MGIDRERLDDALKVIAEIAALPDDDPHVVEIQRAVGGFFKDVKRHRRQRAHQAKLAADAAVTAATATGAPGRIDDETQGIALAARVERPIVGTLIRARSCYICKQRYSDVDAFYHQLCPECAALNHQRRDARTDLTGRSALLTGGRAKIGMYIALRLLRDGAHTTITTRFPKDAARRFTAMEDSADWLHRLRIVGIDLRDPAQVISLADDMAARGPLDILINNATQTVRRTPGSYSHLSAAEGTPLGAVEGKVSEILDFGHVVGAHPPSIEGLARQLDAAVPEALTALALNPEHATLERHQSGTAIDAGGLVPDTEDINSWTRVVQEVDAMELLETQLCNVTAPFLLVSRLRGALAQSTARRAYVVNVSAMEGVFSRGYKGPGHPHTNMAKAAMNMLTRTSAKEMLTDGILMTSVDTGWITDERPHPQKLRLAEEGFQAPLDLADGAARVYDPIVRGELGEDLYGCFLKDYKPAAW